jgi:hypothetical protein
LVTLAEPLPPLALPPLPDFESSPHAATVIAIAAMDAASASWRLARDCFMTFSSSLCS